MFDATLAAIGSGLLILIYAAYQVWRVMKAPAGNEKMQEIAKAIQEGANAFLSRQYKTIAPLAIILALLIGYFIGWNTGLAFVVGVMSSALAGYIGMMVSVRANSRVAEAAKGGLAKALGVAFSGGSVTGMAVVGMGLLALGGLFFYFHDLGPMIGFGFGASLISLFARVGGGIYTKAADVGADLVGKVEKGIPEDDPRNPAVIADNVGDNVGDCAGMAADVYESFVVTVIAAMLLGSALTDALNSHYELSSDLYIQIPLLLASLGGLASVIGSLFVSVGKDKKVMMAFYKGILASAILMALGAYLILPFDIFLVSVVGIAVTALIFLITEYYTAKEYGPVQAVANASKTGAGTNLIQGLAIGMQSTALPALLIVAAIVISFKLGATLGPDPYLGGIYAVALAAGSMLSLSGIVIAIDSYGPITDNAGGIAEMSGLAKDVREVTDELDAVGNTTKATTKGFAIAGAALGALALFAAFANEAAKLNFTLNVNLLDPAVTVGLFIGALLPFIFSSFLMTAVGKAAFHIVEEVRRQFREIKGLMEGTGRPDYARAVDISTKTALNELMVPGILAVFTPIVIGLLFGMNALGGLLGGVIASGFLLALMMCTTGATWDNAKKYIEEGHFGGKGSDAHKAAVVGDTVGDPFKDTAGPALNALIKVVNTVSLVFAALILKYGIKLL